MGLNHFMGNSGAPGQQALIQGLMADVTDRDTTIIRQDATIIRLNARIRQMQAMLDQANSIIEKELSGKPQQLSNANQVIEQQEKIILLQIEKQAAEDNLRDHREHEIRDLEKQNETIAKWMLSQKAFKEVALQFGEQLDIDEEGVAKEYQKNVDNVLDNTTAHGNDSDKNDMLRRYREKLIEERKQQGKYHAK